MYASTCTWTTTDTSGGGGPGVDLRPSVVDPSDSTDMTTDDDDVDPDVTPDDVVVASSLELPLSLLH